MRISAIRGCNLASLESFDVDFDAAPLAQTRLFSIVGPTGAGKSTLLDAMCLALFDRVPRLVDVRDGAPPEDDLSPRDPRALLRRGAAEGLAEVDFVGTDGARYRARWEVWRARGKRDGRVQSQRVRLFGLDPERELSGKHKTETLDLIVDALGLGFDEFRRSVLLAQGDFAAFLKARPEERAALLERMTATEIFSRVSVVAFRHAQQLEAERERLLEAQQHIEIADDGARAAWREERARRAEGLPALEAAHEAAQSAWARADAAARAQAAVANAERAKIEADAAWDAATEARERLQLAERAERLRPAWDRARAARAAREAAVADHQTAEQTHRDAAARREAATAQANAARVAAEQATEVQKSKRPELDAARALDASLAESDQTVAARLAELDDARPDLEAALETARSARAALEDADASARAAAEVEDSLAMVRRLEASWDEAGVDVDRLERAVARERELRTQLEALEPKRAGLSEATARARSERDATAAARDRTRAATRAAQEALDAERGSAGTPRSRTEALARLARALANAKDLARVLDETAPRHRALGRARREAERQRTRLKKARADLRRTTRRDRQLEGEHDQLAARLSMDTLRRDLHQHRHALLAADAPCPLCGADSSARGEPEAAATGALDRAEKRLEKISAQRAKLAEKRRELQRAEDEAAAKEREAKERAIDHEKAIAATREQWQERREALTLIWLDSGLLAQRGVHRWALLLPESPDRSALSELVVQLVDLERALESEARGDEARAAEVERLRHAEGEAERAAASASERLDAALERERSIELELQLAHQSRTTAAADRDAADRELRPRLHGWPEAEARLDADPGALGALLRPAVDRLRAAREAARTHAATAERAREARARADADLWTQHRIFETVRARVERARARHAALERDRASKLDGRPAAAVAEELEQRVTAARAALGEAQTAEQKSQSAEAAAKAVLQRSAAAKTKAEQEADARARELDAAIAESQLPREQLEDLFERRPEDLEAERARIEALREARARARTTLEDRRAQAEAAHADGLDEPTARTQRDAARSALEVEAAAVRELDAKLTRDDEARAKRDALAPQLAALESRLVTARDLSALIGSADGKRLRTFAQGLTLEALVERANLHLERLRPRYRLVRAAGRDIDLRVLDRDLGDEIRAVATLSGGETFLVSLALALGLSGLSSRDVRVESMFIDEGFGHLDRDSLELALATLDELQAEGRTIGIVSHVPDLAERIGYVVDVQPTGPGQSRVQVRAV